MTVIKPILRYPGAKWSIAPWVVSYLPPHKHYIEPFFGSGAVFFSKPPAPHEVINDLSGDVVNLFRVIRDDGERLAALVELTPWARDEYDLSYAACDDPTERARRLIVRSWQGHAGVMDRTAENKSGWSSQGVSLSYVCPGEKWRRLPPRITALVRRLGPPTEIENRPALEVIARHRSPDVLIYADPPYPLSTRNDTMYQHEMTDADHSALLDALDAHPGPVVLSGYHCPLYDNRLAHWHTVERKTQAEKGNTRTEVLWLNDAARPQQMRLL